MTVSVSNTNLNDSFNAWRLNTNFAATVISNNVVTVSRAGSANRGGVAKGNGHVAGTFTANELRTVRLHSGNTSNEGNFIQIASNTAVNATSFSVTANAIFQGNVDFLTSGTDRIILGDISRIRVTGGTRGQFLRTQTETDVIDFKSLTLRDISDMSSNSAHLILSGSNTNFSDNGDSPHLILSSGNGTDRAHFYLASDAVAGDSDVYLNLLATDNGSGFVVADSSNTAAHSFFADGTQVSTANVQAVGFTTSGNILPVSDDANDIGAPNREFRNAYFDGTVTTDVLSVATGASQGVSASLIPTTDAAGNLGSSTRKWGTVWADTTNGGAGVFNTLGVSTSLVVNGSITLNNDNFNFNGNTVLGNASTDTVTFNASIDSDFIPVNNDGTGHYDLGTTAKRWNQVFANTVYANNVNVDNNATIEGNLTVNGTTSLASGQTFTSPIGRFTNVHATTLAEFNGTTIIGDASSDTLTINAVIDSDLIPDHDDGTGHYDLGDTDKRWHNLYANNAYANNLTTDNDATVTRNLTVSGLSTFSGHRITVSGNGFFSDSIDVADSIDVTNSITNDGTVMLGKNGKLHANNTISAKTITSTMIANTMTSGGNFGSATEIPVFQVNDRGQIIGITQSNTASIKAFGYTQSNNTIRLATNSGTVYTDVIDAATTTATTGRGVASFDSGDFSLSSGHVSLADSATGAVIGISATTGETTVSRTNGTVTIGLPDDVSITSDLTVGGGVFVSGNLEVSGTLTTVDTTNMTVKDKLISLNEGAATNATDLGIVFNRGSTGSNAIFIWDESADKFSLGTGAHGADATAALTVTKGTLIADVEGTAELANTAVKLQSARNIGVNLTGDVTGYANVDFQGTSDVLVTVATTYNNDVVLGTDTSGSYVSTITGGTGIASSGATTGEGVAHTLSVDLSELTDMTAAMVGTDEFIVLDAGADRRKAANEIGLSIFNNDAGFSTTTGTVTSIGITASNGIDVSGSPVTSSGNITVSIESDLRGDAWQIGRDTNDYYIVNTTTHDWYLDGVLDMRLQNDGNLHVEGNVVAHSAVTSSDIKLKENIKIIENPVAKVQQIKGVEFTWKKDGNESAGVIAQDVEQILPQAVTTVKELNSDDSYKAVNYDALIGLLVESIKELKAEIDELKKNK